jgi:hypothetical protein
MTAQDPTVYALGSEDALVVSGKIDAKNARGQFEANLLMSALGHKQTSETHAHNVRFTPESGHLRTPSACSVPRMQVH